MADDCIESENVRNLIKTGKRVERIDLYARLQYDLEKMEREICRLTGRIVRTNLMSLRIVSVKVMNRYK